MFTRGVAEDVAGGAVNAWMCNRCGAVSNAGDVDDPPSDWVRRDVPVRGSKGARSSTVAVICDRCDDSLYEWLHAKDATP